MAVPALNVGWRGQPKPIINSFMSYFRAKAAAVIADIIAKAKADTPIKTIQKDIYLAFENEDEEDKMCAGARIWGEECRKALKKLAKERKGNNCSNCINFKCDD